MEVRAWPVPPGRSGREKQRGDGGPELTEVTGRTQPGPEGGSSRGRLGDLGGCDHPSLWQASEGSGITGRLWLQKAGSESQPVRKLASRIFQRHEAEARCLVQEENRTLRSNSSSVASTSPRSPWPEHGVRGEKKRPSLQNGAHTPCPACSVAIDVESPGRVTWTVPGNWPAPHR